MRPRRRLLVYLGTCAAISVAAAGGAAEAATAWVAAASGEWTVSPAAGAPFVPGRVGARIGPGGALRTGAGTVRVRLPGGAELEVAPRTTAGLPILHRRGFGSVAQATLLRGAVRLRERTRARRYVEVATPVATVGVRGTDFSVSYDGREAEVEVYDGAVRVDPDGFGEAEADVDGDGVPAWLDADVDGDGSPNTSDPEDLDPAVEGAEEVGYAEVAIDDDAVLVEEGEEAEVEAGDEAPDVTPLPEGAEEKWQEEGEAETEPTPEEAGEAQGEEQEEEEEQAPEPEPEPEAHEEAE